LRTWLSPKFGISVTGHPVHVHADARLVEAVDQVLEVVGVAEARGRRVVPGDLVAPRRFVGMLGQRQELDVGEAGLVQVVDQLVGGVPVPEPLPP
jgi:hypothetical protein